MAHSTCAIQNRRRIVAWGWGEDMDIIQAKPFPPPLEEAADTTAWRLGRPERNAEAHPDQVHCTVAAAIVCCKIARKAEQKSHLRVNGVRGWVEGWMDGIALPFQRCFKFERMLDIWKGWKRWKGFVTPGTRRVGMSVGIGLNLDARFLRIVRTVGADTGGVFCRVGMSGGHHNRRQASPAAETAAAVRHTIPSVGADDSLTDAEAAADCSRHLECGVSCCSQWRGGLGLVDNKVHTLIRCNSTDRHNATAYTMTELKATRPRHRLAALGSMEVEGEVDGGAGNLEASGVRNTITTRKHVFERITCQMYKNASRVEEDSQRPW
ncbi:uncharacterized protein EV420DRAFT_1486537 [Desarmillaria tabescens]|uniref:Uncharacterized protein n=1 Tax=Armillaria tabescens TaxID=1929756 RepID=A0AA39ML55_ARMTA|nr:uncharacterized protein EV420DRAFT_1486537 [Desarmillaria tabescens]KAK0438886.1 hypothetical protein EV420DRAFT_1486537 [Desarmillaria tabescens]